MERPLDALPEGTKLAGYVIGRVLGRGGFGMTYFGHDALYSDTKVAIKELLPSGLAVREAGSATVHPSGPEREPDFTKALARFEDEARTLVALRHPNVVEVQRYIEANGTAYVVMKFEEGRSLSELLADGKTLSPAELGDLVPPLLDGLEAVHRRNYLHRDIKPGNIYVRAADRSPVLLDFGAARQAMGADRRTSLTEIVTPGYAPFEQYFRKGEQGPWTDIYGLGATFYRCLAGQPPPEAPERMKRDAMISAREVGEGRFPARLLAGIDAMLAVDERGRPQTVAELRTILGPVSTPPSQPALAGATLVAGAAPAAMRSEPPRAVPPTPSPRPAAAAESMRDPVAESVGRQRPIDRQVRARSRAGAAGAILFVLSALVAGAYFALRSDPAAPPESATACRDGSGWHAGCVFRDCPDCPEMVVIPSGTFTMGSPASEAKRSNREGPQHRVTIAKPFALGKYEVTFAEWDACMAAGGCAYRPDDQGWGRGRRPVRDVSWGDATSYAAWLSRKTGKSYRLPSEAEWEYAARAGTTTPFSTGATISTDQANYDGNFVYGNGQKGVSRQRTVPVGSFAANRFGVHDMHGNVWEYVEDCWNANYTGAPSDGRAWLSGDCSGRIVRGGSWGSEPEIARSAFRDRGDTGYRSLVSGFRVARTLD